MDDVELLFVPWDRLFRHFAQGWDLVSTMADSKHGEWSVLMERPCAD